MSLLNLHSLELTGGSRKMASSGDEGLEGTDEIPPNFPKEDQEEWSNSPTSVQNYAWEMFSGSKCQTNLKKQVAKLKKELTESKGSLKASDLEVAKMREEIKKLQGEKAAMETKVFELEAKLEGEEKARKVNEGEAAALTLKLEESEGKWKTCEEEIKQLQVGKTAMEAVVSELESKLEGEEKARKNSEDKVAASKLKLEESERARKTCKEKASQIQQELEMSQKNASALQGEMEGLQVELEGVRKQLEDQESASTKILKSWKDETKRWKMMAVKCKAFIRSVSREVSEESDDELDEDADISQNQLTKLEKALKSRLQEGEENKKIFAGHYAHVLKLAKNVRKKTEKRNTTTENNSHEARNTDQPPTILPPNSSPLQNYASNQPGHCVMENAKNSYRRRHLIVRLNAKADIRNPILDNRRKSSEGDHSFQDNHSSSSSDSSDDAPPFSPIASNVSVNEEQMDDASTISKRNRRLNEDGTNTNRSRIPPIPDAPLNPSHPGRFTRNIRKRRFPVRSCNSSIKMMKASVFKATNSLRGRPFQSVNQKTLLSFKRLQEELPLLSDVQGPPVRRQRRANFSKKGKFRCKGCDRQFNNRSALISHKKTIHAAEYVTPGRKKGRRSTVSSQRSPSTPQRQRQHGRDTSDPSNRRCLCGKVFINRTTLAQHLDVTLFGKIYGCVYCENNYSHLQQMKNHVQNYHAGKNYDGSKVRCGLCQEEYTTGNYVRYHCHRVHKA